MFLNILLELQFDYFHPKNGSSTTSGPLGVTSPHHQMSSSMKGSVGDMSNSSSSGIGGQLSTSLVADSSNHGGDGDSKSNQETADGAPEDDEEATLEENRRMKLQLYVFVLRCISYPFNAKQPTDMARRQAKVGSDLLLLQR